ncbi:uncharacterized protein P174DRAFT_431719 [Aspergillus novofumigatus IBT 16806]|uniref:Uncharacterized protein n=1 Tax=Aspergillus novofumigatus (strain IBT 16806) TaxID=1392255 RepID=A0A2I1C3S8_ASPN1|nr:uncharacterized protein P174DRAFT_431719 [Aspergillus novofumigatus IBT 16806]PKX92289.1 hypothetical protein P174DRAFT_431719 [Aspergillus novofumigatus IBT 16806]
MTLFSSTWLRDLRERETGPKIRFTAYYDGNKAELDAEINNSIQQDQPRSLFRRRSLAEPSTRFFHEILVAQWSKETIRAFPAIDSYRVFTSFVFPDDDDNEKRTQAVTSIVNDQLNDIKHQGLLSINQVSISLLEPVYRSD